MEEVKAEIAFAAARFKMEWFHQGFAGTESVARNVFVDVE